MAGDGDDGANGILRRVAENPRRGRAELPRLLGYLTAESSSARSAAARAIRLVADHRPETRRYLRAQVSAHADYSSPSPEVSDLLSYLESMPTDDDAADAFGTVVVTSDEDDPPPVPDAPGGTSRGPRRRYGRNAAGEADDEETETETGTAEPDTRSDRKRGGRGGASHRDARRIAAIASRSRFSNLELVGRERRPPYELTAYHVVASSGHKRQRAVLCVVSPPEAADAEGFVADFQRAIRAWRTVHDHTNVRTVHDWGTDPTPWFITEQAAEPLTARLPLSAADALAHCVRLADAVAYAHRRDVVHGGISPTCVVSARDGLGDAPILLDAVRLAPFVESHFGHRRSLDPRCVAPEWFDADYGPVDEATDVYHLGAMCYVALTGAAPVTGCDVATVRESVLTSSPRPPTDRRSGLPPRVDALVAKALSKQKLLRYESAQHFRDELADARATVRRRQGGTEGSG